jgi:hypothetical protein
MRRSDFTSHARAGAWAMLGIVIAVDLPSGGLLSRRPVPREKYGGPPAPESFRGAAQASKQRPPLLERALFSLTTIGYNQIEK